MDSLPADSSATPEWSVIHSMMDHGWEERMNDDKGSELILQCGRANGQRALSEWKDELANLLTFIGLFSAVVTSFVAFSLPLLSEDSATTSAQLLAQISLQLSSFTVSSQLLNSTSPPLSRVAFKTDPRIVHLNVLWILSLTMSLMAGFFTISAQQWLRRIPLPTNLSVDETIRLRQLRHASLHKWKVPEIVSLLPITVQISVVLFLAGLLFLLDTLSQAVARTFLAFAAALFLLWTVMSILPLFIHDCPYKTPLIPVLIAIVRICTPFPAYHIILITNLICFPIKVFRRRTLHHMDSESTQQTDPESSPHADSESPPQRTQTESSPPPMHPERSPPTHQENSQHADSGRGRTVPGCIRNVRGVPRGSGEAGTQDVSSIRTFLSAAQAIASHLAAITEQVRVWLIHRISLFYQSLSYPMSFWDDQDIQAIARRDAILDSSALVHASYMVPKNLLYGACVQRVAQILPLNRPLFALRFIAAQLRTRQLEAFDILNLRTTVLFTNRVDDLCKALGDIRNVLLLCLPDKWVSGTGSFSDKPGEAASSNHPYDQDIADLLHFIHRSLLPSLRARPGTTTTSDSLLGDIDKFTKILHELCLTQDWSSIINSKPNTRLPMTLLFKYYHDGTLTPLYESQEVDTTKSRANLLCETITLHSQRWRWRTRATLSPHFPSYYEISFLETALCAVGIALLTEVKRRNIADSDSSVKGETWGSNGGEDGGQSTAHVIQQQEDLSYTAREGDHSIHGAQAAQPSESPVQVTLSVLLKSLKNFLFTTADEIVFLTDQISYLPETSHIFMLIPAIESIAESLAKLAEALVPRAGQIADSDHGLLEETMDMLETICDAPAYRKKFRNVERSFKDFKGVLEKSRLPSPVQVARESGDIA